MAKHRLVIIGDSLSQGFMSGAIHRADLSYPVWVAEVLGVRSSFVVHEFSGEGGLPLNLEQVLNEISRSFGSVLNWWEAVPAFGKIQRLLDVTEDYWERGRGVLVQRFFISSDPPCNAISHSSHLIN